ncbi:FAD-dependent oxidoreductase [Halobaculum litoreum]|nr:FAD-dependent oxidoreductase [Halobaculum sp. DT92]
MARADTVEGTVGADPDSAVDHDVLVVGGGVAGLSAATFLSRYGLDTLVLARGKSAIGQCAHLENYLGFPAGISPERFLALGREQATYEGATVREELVECVATVDLAEHGVDAGGPSDLPASRGGFAVDSDEGEYVVRYVLAATAYDGDMFEPLEDRLDTDAEYGAAATDHGRTTVTGLYAAGWLTDETVHQAVVNAGHGARAATSLARDDLDARFWPGVGDNLVDWVVYEDRYAVDDEWEADTREWFDREVVGDATVDDATVEAAYDVVRSEYVARMIDAEEAAERDRAGQRRLLAHVDDDVIREYLDGDDEPAGC